MEWNKKTPNNPYKGVAIHGAGRLGQPSHPWHSRNGALGISPCSEPLWRWSSRSSQGSYPMSHEVKGLRFKARKYILKSWNQFCKHLGLSLETSKNVFFGFFLFLYDNWKHVCPPPTAFLEASALRRTSPAARWAGNSPNLHKRAKVKPKSQQSQYWGFQEAQPVV